MLNFMAVVTVSFQDTTYAVVEGRLQNVCVNLAGLIERNVVVAFSTEENSATGC